jgi:hypothetical protein
MYIRLLNVLCGEEFGEGGGGEERREGFPRINLTNIGRRFCSPMPVIQTFKSNFACRII